jgi:hypothetical protein
LLHDGGEGVSGLILTLLSAHIVRAITFRPLPLGGVVKPIAILGGSRAALSVILVFIFVLSETLAPLRFAAGQLARVFEHGRQRAIVAVGFGIASWQRLILVIICA